MKQNSTIWPVKFYMVFMTQLIDDLIVVGLIQLFTIEMKLEVVLWKFTNY
jgi:hypothetical protein